MLSAVMASANIYDIKPVTSAFDNVVVNDQSPYKTKTRRKL
ncbi:MAG TPA: hypothetical protein VIY08_09085 [Candidatus Nitrosocosmicus sp.]